MERNNSNNNKLHSNWDEQGHVIVKFISRKRNGTNQKEIELATMGNMFMNYLYDSSASELRENHCHSEIWFCSVGIHFQLKLFSSVCINIIDYLQVWCLCVCCFVWRNWPTHRFQSIGESFQAVLPRHLSTHTIINLSDRIGFLLHTFQFSIQMIVMLELSKSFFCFNCGAANNCTQRIHNEEEEEE